MKQTKAHQTIAHWTKARLKINKTDNAHWWVEGGYAVCMVVYGVCVLEGCKHMVCDFKGLHTRVLKGSCKGVAHNIHLTVL